ncbi:hypothetical protein [Pseudaquabacterium pictum]|uniref:Uncharacterized protein n=1 Tax=Pseudaquabacterium pictum TaxID=2315236 RepID=A0A480AH98_9BURK|nr:hypothetical protein [Rubrivivax pictus]GCL61024.1 hypothetical protein AQPW35_01050 [Rubrivivax pictus]
MNTIQPLDLMTPADYVAKRSQIFPGVESLRWFERQHRAELIECGAVLMPNGRKLVDPAAFDRAVVEIGKRMATARQNRGAA